MCRLPPSCVAAWLSEVVDSWLWELPPERLRVALLLLAKSRAEGAERVTRTTSDEIAVACRISRGAAIRALRALGDGGFCRIETRRGSDGVTVIRLTTVKHEHDISEPVVADHLHVLDIVVEGLLLEGGRDHLRLVRGDHLEARGIAGDSDQSGEGRDHLRGDVDLAASIPSEPKTGVNPQSPVAALPGPSSPDQDLSGPGPSDPDLQPPEKQTSREPVSRKTGVTVRGDVGSRDSGVHQLSLLGEPEFVADPVTPPAPTDQAQIDGAEYAARRAAIASRIDATMVPDRAFAAADWLRAYVMAMYPSAAVARYPWGPAKVGDRLIWARELTVIAEPRAKGRVGRDGRGWDEVARVVKWLFEDQTGEHLFVVQSPTALREKWGRIQAVREQQRKPQRKPAALSRRTFTRWDDDWGKPGSGSGCGT